MIKNLEFISDESSENYELIKQVLRNLQGYVDFYDSLIKGTEPGWPTWSQSIRIKALLENKRILVADDTGVNGKTFTAVASKFCLDDKLGKRNPTIVIAPNNGMLNAWNQDEINRYALKINAPEQKVVTIRDYGDLQSIAIDTDFVVINWEKLSISENDRRFHKLMNAIKQFDPRFFIFDESHNAKGSSSLRSKRIQDIIKYTTDKYVMLLSATPIPNRYRDLSMVFHMLNPKKYTSPNMFSYAPAEVMKELLDQHCWFRLTREDLKEELGLPDFIERIIPIPLRNDEAEIYFKEWADCVTLGEGLTSLRKALYNPGLSKYSSEFNGKASKLERIAALVEEVVRKGEKAIIKTNYVNNGIINDIVEAVSQGKKRKVLVAHGETNLEDRKTIYWQFRNNPIRNILVLSSVGEESIDLTTGDIPLHLIPYEPEITPREFNQFTGRGYRRGQRGIVTHYTFVTESPILNQLMLDYLNELSEKHGLKIPKKFIPRTIDTDMLAMRRSKQKTVDDIYGCKQISRKEEGIYDADEINRARTYLQGLVNPQTFSDINPFALASIKQAFWRNLGEEQFKELVKSKGWKKWRNLYENGWKNSASYETNRFIGQIIDLLEKRGENLENIVSIGDGRAYFSRATHRPCLGIDLDEKWLELGKKDCDKRKILYEYKVSGATDTGVNSDSVDAVINAYCIFYLKQGRGYNEVEKAIIETNRIIRDNGYSIHALPCSLEENRVREWSSRLKPYGFVEITYYTPEQTKCDNMKKGVHILVHQKTHSNTTNHGLDISFYENTRRFIG